METGTTADACFVDAVRLGGTQQYREAALRFIQHYVGDVAPGPDAIATVYDFTRMASTDAASLRIAQDIADALSVHGSSSRLKLPPIAEVVASADVPQETHGRGPFYTSLAPFRVHIPQRAAPRRSVPIIVPSDAECSGVIEEKCKGIATGRKLGFTLVKAKDYVEQTPLAATESVLDQQLRVLETYRSDYNSSPAVTHASWVLIKLAMDAFVHRVPLPGAFGHLREVSMAFLRPIRMLLRGEYLCVRRHTYNLLASMASHVQLLDSMDSFAGSTLAVEREVAWIVTQVVTYQWLVVDHDDRMWTSALKCCLLVLPETSWPDLPTGALMSMMLLPAVLSSHPSVFEVLVNALLQRAQRHQSDRATMLRQLGGVAGVVELLAHAPTTRAASSTVRLLLAVGVQPADEPISEKALVALDALRVPWYLHQLANQLVPAAFARELAHAIVADLDSDAGEAKRAVGNIIQRVVLAIAQQQQLPVAPAQLALAQPGDVMNTVAKLSRDDYDVDARYLAARLGTEVCRTEWTKEGASTHASDCLVQMARSRHPRTAQVAQFVIRRCVRMLSAAGSRGGARALLRTLLQGGPLPLPLLMTIYRELLETVAIVVVASHADGDISGMVESGSMVVPHASIDAIQGEHGQQTLLWQLYWALRASDASSATSPDAVRHARLVIVSLLAHHEQATSSPGDLIPTWHRVMEDPHPACAVVGSHRLVRIAGIAQYDSYEAAIHEAQQASRSDVLRHPFMMAASILERIASEGHATS